MAIGCDSPLPDAVRRRSSPSSLGAIPTALYIPCILTISSVVIFFLHNLPFSVYYIRLFMKYFFILPNYIILESAIYYTIAHNVRIMRCHKEGTINCRHRDIFILDIYLYLLFIFTVFPLQLPNHSWYRPFSQLSKDLKIIVVTNVMIWFRAM